MAGCYHNFLRGCSCELPFSFIFCPPTQQPSETGVYVSFKLMCYKGTKRKPQGEDTGFSYLIQVFTLLFYAQFWEKEIPLSSDSLPNQN